MALSTFTSEAVSQGHPDKIADQISDAILDACLTEDPTSRVACETLITDGLVMLAGEISSKAHIEPREIVRSTIRGIGYDDPDFGFDFNSCGVVYSFHKQSEDIAKGVEKGGAGDQGIMFGYATDETPELMPMPIILAHKILNELRKCRLQNQFSYLGPDAKSQVTVQYENGIPKRIAALVLSTQHRKEISFQQLKNDVMQVINKVTQDMIDKNTKIFINPSGDFIIGGPKGDTGLTGRKIMVDTYGGMGRNGGGAFSGKDPTKVDRSAAYMARYLAKNIVASKLAKKCEIQLAYAIGIPEPITINVETFGTGVISNAEFISQIRKFDLTPQGMIKKLDLLRPIYHKTAYGGHFGRSDPDFTWETVDSNIFTSSPELTRSQI